MSINHSHCFFAINANSLATAILFCVCISSLPAPGSDCHAGGAGDLLRAAAAEAAEEDVLPEEGEASGQPGDPGARPPVHHHVRRQHNHRSGQKPDVCQCPNSGVSQR